MDEKVKRTACRNMYSLNIRPNQLNLYHNDDEDSISLDNVPMGAIMKYNTKIKPEQLQKELDTLGSLLREQKFFMEKNIKKKSDLNEIA
jgi:hypothetical protein